MSYISDFKTPPIDLFGVIGGVNSTDKSLATLVGVKFSSADGRVFTLIQNGGTALVAGNVIQGPVSIGANHTGLALSTAAIGSKLVSVTMGGTLCTANQYQGGYLVVSAGTGLGQTLRIASHPAGTSAGVVVFTLEDTLSVATASTDSKGSLTLNPYGSQFGTDATTSGCVISPTTATGPTVGVSITPIPASTATVPMYGFIQTHGPVACLNIAGTAIGLDVMPGSGTAGSAITYVAATRNRIGTAMVAGENAKAQMIMLQL